LCGPPSLGRTFWNYRYLFGHSSPGHGAGCKQDQSQSNLIVTPYISGPAKILLCPTDFDIFTLFFERGLFVALMMEAVRTSETSVYYNETTRPSIPEDRRHLHF
jgi:hypothetical protein